MPSWSHQDEEMYEAIKASLLERGTPEDRAEEIAARTVNKRRRLEGRTPNRTTMGTGNPYRRLEARHGTRFTTLPRSWKSAGGAE